MTLKPITDNMPSTLTAHGVRKLRICEGCTGLGHADYMVNGEWHTGCFRRAKGFKEVLKLDAKERNKFRIKDLSVKEVVQLGKAYWRSV